MKSVDGNKKNIICEVTLKKILLSISLLLLISDLGYAATRRIYINFDNRPAVNTSTGEFTLDTSPGLGKIRMVYWGGTGMALPSVLGSQHQYITGRTGTGYALSGIIGGDGVGTWPYIDWQANQSVPWSNNIYVSFWMKYVSYKVDKTIKPYQNIKLFYWKWTGSYDSSLMGEIAAGNVPNGSPPPYNEYTLSWRGKYPYLGTPSYLSKYPSYSDCEGKWHHYVFYIQRTAGRARWWIDDHLIMDWNTGDAADFGDGTGISYLHFAGSLIGTGPNSKGTRAFDDIEVWDGMPDSASYISTPPSTSEKSPNPPVKLSIQ